MKKITLLFFLFSIIIIPLRGQGGNWLRYPSISPDGKTIVFTYKGDLWKVATAGGSATPLTLIAMKGVYPYDEIARLPLTHRVINVIQLNVPQIEGARHLVIVESADA